MILIYDTLIKIVILGCDFISNNDINKVELHS